MQKSQTSLYRYSLSPMPHSFLLLHLYIWVRKRLLNIFQIFLTYMINYDCPTPYQLLLDTVQQTAYRYAVILANVCQFLLGTVQHAMDQGYRGLECVNSS